MTLDKNKIIAAIKSEVCKIASGLGGDASDLQADELIPASGLIDSAGLLELIAWYEKEYSITISADDFTIDNLGTMNSMADFLLRRGGSL